jgi:hypothetical protein
MLHNNIIYKLKDSEALILDATGIIFPLRDYNQELDISTTNRVIYRFITGQLQQLHVNQYHQQLSC